MVYRNTFCSHLHSVFFMRKLRLFTLSLITVLSLFCGTGGITGYAKGMNEGVSALFHDTQNAFVFYLDNGMEVILVENHASPMITAFTIVKTGSCNEDASTNGCAHFLEHLLFNGTKSRTQKQLYDEMDFYGGYNNAHTTTDYTNFMILMPKEFIGQGMD